ncbi:hypothetical protein AHIS1636_08200 [Arthrobacter mangrovi]|uniref:Transporter n=1 Tax=Arthrobacter mangrovi TaxID=2966350 RepID=A0ABQ5MQW9_9MICC|nr:hypothetical protein AHIS1636_08200 [Arthrobacter mangrovi]
MLGDGAAFYQSQAATGVLLGLGPCSATTAGVAAEIAPKATSRPAVMLAILLNMSFPFWV